MRFEIYNAAGISITQDECMKVARSDLHLLRVCVCACVRACSRVKGWFGRLVDIRLSYVRVLRTRFVLVSLSDARALLQYVESIALSVRIFLASSRCSH